ncbi:MAG TPA: FlgD immunoglobulin-like domain containing protein [Candidatus Krumholzibacteria bacterium]|nr:FlgD immunoglobulin-like domain containing protein [Candidatus Krumholzibacteria bacterium]
MRVSIAVTVLVCLLVSTPQARISFPQTDKSASGGDIQPVVVVDGSPVHNVGNLWVHASNWGAIGSQPGSALPFSDAPSAQWPGGSNVEYLYVAGLWVGALVNGVPHVSTSAYQIEFRPSPDPRDTVYRTAYGALHGNRIPADPDDDSDGAVNEDPLDGYDNDGDGLVDEDFAAISDQMFSRNFRDDDPTAISIYPLHVPMHLAVHEESYQFSDPDYDDFAGFTFSITNDGSDVLQDMYIGMFADGDVGNRNTPNYWEDDATGFASVPVDFGLHGSGTFAFPYWRDADGDGGEATGDCGFVLLDYTTDPAGVTAPTTVSLHTLANFSGYASYADGGDPTNDFERYEVMSSGVIGAPKSGDVRTLMAVGPFPSVAPGQTVTFTVALVVTPNDFSNVEHAAVAYVGQWFDLDHDPNTGIDGKEHQEHWYLPGHAPVPVAISRFDARLARGGVELRWDAVSDESIDDFTVLRTAAGAAHSLPIAHLGGSERRFVDTAVTPGTTYDYTLAASTSSGSVFTSPVVTVHVPTLTTRVGPSAPNPFRESTSITVDLAEATTASLSVYDAAGRRVATLASGPRAAGTYEFSWNGTDDRGRRVAAGVYFYRLQAGKHVYSRKVLLVR